VATSVNTKMSAAAITTIFVEEGNNANKNTTIIRGR